MRVIRAAALLTLLLAGPVLAQAPSANKPPPQAAEPPKTPSQLESDKAAESAYKRSLGNIPDKPAADPWGGARAVDSSSSTTTTTAPAKRTKTSTGTTN
jgi:hypothetical protein